MNAKLSTTMWRLERCFAMPAFAGSRTGRGEGYAVASNVAIDALQSLKQHTPALRAVSLV
jgi:hypothetical protein